MWLKIEEQIMGMEVACSVHMPCLGSNFQIFGPTNHLIKYYSIMIVLSFIIPFIYCYPCFLIARPSPQASSLTLGVAGQATMIELSLLPTSLVTNLVSQVKFSIVPPPFLSPLSCMHSSLITIIKILVQS